MTIEELAKLYQDGTDWNDEMEAHQNAYIVDNVEEIFRDFIEIKKGEAEDDPFAFTFGSYIGLRKGMWQADHGFTRPFDMDRLMKEVDK